MKKLVLSLAVFTIFSAVSSTVVTTVRPSQPGVVESPRLLADSSNNETSPRDGEYL